MALSRPFGKELLKKMALKGMAECRPGGRFSGYGGSVTGATVVQHLIPELFETGQLTGEEFLQAHRAVFELERDGLIMHDPHQSSSFKMLTDLGRKVVTESLEKMRLPAIDIGQILSRDDLRALVRDDFNAGEYETAVFKAFRYLEESVRAKAAQPPAAIGVNLMTAAFRPNGGVLKHPGAQVDSEAEALHHLMRGAIGWFKNPSSHRTVGYGDVRQAAQILAFANLLLELLDQSSR